MADGQKAEGALAAADLLAAYLRWLQGYRSLAGYTLRNYQNDVMAFLRYLEERSDVAVTGVDRAVVRGYLSSLLDRGIAAGSIRRQVSALRSFYAFLAREGQVAANPLGDGRSPNRVRGPKKAQRLPSFLDAAEVARLIAAADGDAPAAQRDHAILELLYGAGVRVSELVGLDTESVNLRERRLIVRGKGDKERLVIIGRPARNALRLYIDSGRPLLAAKADEPAPSTGSGQALFLNRHGGRLSVRAVQILVRRYALQAGIAQRVYPHLLRHTFATHMVDNDADIRVVQELMGHARADTTQIYAHVTAAQQRRVYDAAFYNQRRPKPEEDDE